LGIDNVSKQSIDLFLEACGIVGPLEVTIESQGTENPSQRLLFQPFALIGRDPRTHILLNHPEVSRRHAYLQVLGGRPFFMDLESRQGTHWETGAKRSGWLEPGKAIRIGSFLLRVKPTAAPDGTIPGDGWFGQALPEVTLEFANRATQSTTWRMSSVLAFAGRSPECRVHLVGESVSSFHCSLVRTPLGLWVVDLFGRNGILVNDAPCRFALLEEGDQLQVGKFLICARYHSPPPASTTGLNLQYPPVSLEPPKAEQFSEQPPEIVVSPTPVAASGPAQHGVTNPPVEGSPMMLVPANHAELQSEIAHELLVPVAKQLSLMQQQMFDQFQQAMMMMFQMFNTLQRDQISVIRQELDHLHQLTDELHKLQDELAKQSLVTPSAPPARRDGPVTTSADRWSNGPRSGTPPQVSPPVSSAWPAGPKPTTPSPGLQTSGTPAASGPSTPTAAPAVGQPATRSTAAPIDPKFHTYLADRIAAIQQERQTRWQKVMSFLGRK
jgi:pSer/pThr/pTyr-binding forkhead associated (FHA) protein